MTAEEILQIYAAQGAGAYLGEPVSVGEHALQSAFFAEAAGASGALVLAALLHDIGHLVEPAPEDISEWKSDARHELTGSRWLACRFGAEVYEPVRLHVPAKRYLCATEASYVKALSPASVITLKLQGGPMSPSETAAFEAEPYWQAALLVRRCDDQGKVQGLRTPDFGHYRSLIEQWAVRPRGAQAE
jgi:phosphonate degradation associated HDIG domain protein